MTPVIYMKEMLKKRLLILLIYNPFYYFVEIYQNIFLYSKEPDINSIGIILIVTFCTLIIAGILYKKNDFNNKGYYLNEKSP